MPQVVTPPDASYVENWESRQEGYPKDDGLLNQIRHSTISNYELGRDSQSILLAEIFDNFDNPNFDIDLWKRNVKLSFNMVRYEGTMSEAITYIIGLKNI